jgi:hypothetical protein
MAGKVVIAEDLRKILRGGEDNLTAEAAAAGASYPPDLAVGVGAIAASARAIKKLEGQ